MLISIRSLSFPSLDAGAARLVVQHPSFTLRLAEFRGGIVEDRLFEAAHLRSTVADWPVVSVILAGRGIVRDHAATASAGRRELVWSPRGAGFRARSCEHGTRALILQWDPDVFGRCASTTFTTARLTRSEFAKIEAATEQVIAARYDVARASAAVGGLFTMLAALGLVNECPAPAELWSPTAGDILRTGAAVDRALSNLGANPMSVDLEASLGRSAAQTRRLVQAYGAFLQRQEVMSWRRQRNLWRMYIGALLMTSPRGDTDSVAPLLGYSSAAAFCHAFADAGLPSPGNIRHVVKQLA